jgi:protein ImuB
VLVVPQSSGGTTRQLIDYVSPATPMPIAPGMALTEARAYCADLASFPTTPAEDDRALEALARWLIRFSPDVSVCPPAGIFLNVTGLERLFGGPGVVRQRVARSLEQFGIDARVVVAPTPGAAWALAAFGGRHRSAADNGPLVITDTTTLPAAMGPLPPAALRLTTEQLAALRALGVRTIDALLRIPRGAMAARLGADVLLRIDQALGTVAEPLVTLQPRTSVRAAMEFEGAIEAAESIICATERLLDDVIAQLARRGLGARQLKITWRPPYGAIVEKTVGLARPSRNRSNLLNLLRCATENMEAEGGVIAMELAAPSTQRLGHAQPALVGGEAERDAAHVDELITRLAARLGRGVAKMELVAAHVPELACRARDALAAATPGLTITTEAPRPTRLLAEPRSIRVIVTPSESREGLPVSFTDDRGVVHRLTDVHGPERITGQWWNGRWKTRDYFDAQDKERGSRYWIFRVADTGAWFLHGVYE